MTNTFTVLEFLAGKWRAVWSFDTEAAAIEYAHKLGTKTKVEGH